MDWFEYSVCHYLALRYRQRKKANNSNNVPKVGKDIKLERKKRRQKARKKMAAILKAKARQKEAREKQYQELAQAAQKKEQEEKEWQEKKEQMRLEKEREEAERIKKEKDEPKIKIEKIDDPEDDASENKHVDLNIPVKKLIVHQETQTEDIKDFVMSTDVDSKPSVLDYTEKKVNIFHVYKVIPITFCEPVKTTLILHHKDPRRKIFKNCDYSEKYQLDTHLSPYSPELDTSIEDFEF